MLFLVVRGLTLTDAKQIHGCLSASGRLRLLHHPSALDTELHSQEIIASSKRMRYYKAISTLSCPSGWSMESGIMGRLIRKRDTLGSELSRLCFF